MAALHVATTRQPREHCKMDKQSVSPQILARSVMLIFWCCGVHRNKTCYVPKNGTECGVFIQPIEGYDIAVQRSKSTAVSCLYSEWYP
jgi:hypothetical protein